MSQEQHAAREQTVIDAVPLALDHVPDRECEAYDARLTGAYFTSTECRLFGALVVDADTAIEIKTCLRWIADHGSRANRRRGRWKIDRDAHRGLVERDGVYLLAVLDDADALLAWTIVPAADLDPYLSWTTNGDRRGEECHLRWANLLPPAECEAVTRGGGV